MARSVTIILGISFEYPRFREGNRRGGSWIGLTSEREGGSGSLWPAADSVFGIFESRRRRRTSQSAARNVHGGRQWRAIAYISLASRCSRLLITQGSGLGTRVINGSRPRLGYRGTKLRANLPQPYINPDFLSLLSQRGPSLPFSPRPRSNAHARFLWHGTMKRHASYPVPIYSPFPGPPSWLKLCIKNTCTREIRQRYLRICILRFFSRTIDRRNNLFPPRWTINAFKKYS